MKTLTEEQIRIMSLMGVNTINESINPNTLFTLLKRILPTEVLDSPKLYDEYFAAGKSVDNEIKKALDSGTMSDVEARELRALFRTNSNKLGRIIKNSSDLDNLIRNLASESTDRTLSRAAENLRKVIVPLSDETITALRKELLEKAFKTSDNLKTWLDNGGPDFLSELSDSNLTYDELQNKFNTYLRSKGLEGDEVLDYIIDDFLNSSYLKSYLRKNKGVLDPTDPNLPENIRKILTGEEKLTAQESIIDAINDWKVLNKKGVATEATNISTFKRIFTDYLRIFPQYVENVKFLFFWKKPDKSLMTEKFANDLMSGLEDYMTSQIRGGGQKSISKESGLKMLQESFFNLSNGWKVGEELDYKPTWENIVKSIKEGKTYDEQKLMDEYFTKFEKTSLSKGSNPFKDLIEDSAVSGQIESWSKKLRYDLFETYVDANKTTIANEIKNKWNVFWNRFGKPFVNLIVMGQLKSPAEIRRFFILRGYTKKSFIYWVAYRVFITKILLPLGVALVQWLSWIAQLGFGTASKESGTFGEQIFLDAIKDEWVQDYSEWDTGIASILPGYLDDITVWWINLSVDGDEKKAENFIDEQGQKIGITEGVDETAKDWIDKASESAEYKADKLNIELAFDTYVDEETQKTKGYEYILKGLKWDVDISSFYVEDPTDKSIKYYINNNEGETGLQAKSPTKTWGKKQFGEFTKFIDGRLPKTDGTKTQLNQSIKKIIEDMLTEEDKEKFGEDNFKHWKDTFIFKSQDDKNPGQYKEVKINMDDVMDRINHYRKKYDEDDAFVRAVIDTHDDVVKIMFTKDLANIHESVTLRGLALVLRTIKESRGEMEIFSVARPANGNWFLVKGDFTPNQLANMDLEKREPESKEKKVTTKAEDDLKKKEESAINILKRNEKEGIEELPKKVRDKIREKMGQGWSTETPPEELKEFFTTSEINSIFNDKIVIYKLEASREFFDSLVKNSARIVIKRGFCRALDNGKRGSDLSERQKMTVNHILNKCNTKYENKLGLRNF